MAGRLNSVDSEWQVTQTYKPPVDWCARQSCDERTAQHTQMPRFAYGLGCRWIDAVDRSSVAQ